MLAIKMLLMTLAGWKKILITFMGNFVENKFNGNWINAAKN